MRLSSGLAGKPYIEGRTYAVGLLTSCYALFAPFCYVMMSYYEKFILNIVLQAVREVINEDVIKRLDGLEHRMDTLEQHVDKRMDRLEERMDELEERVDKRIDGLEQRIDGLEERVD
jgi:chaperonin cofactor prefoldin